jgi:hypothetical protein
MRMMKPHTGKYSAAHIANIINAKEGWLVMPQIEVPSTGNYVLEFWSINDWVQYHHYAGVWVSTTGGDPTTSTFIEIKELKGSEISEEWKKITVPISATGYAGKTIYIGFKYASNEGNNGSDWYIDDINISNFTGAIDGELEEIISPSTGENLTSKEDVKVLIRNNGSNALSGFSLTLELDGAVIVAETYTGSIPSFGQAEYTFGTKLNLSAFGAYDVTVTLNITGDEIPENNSKTKKTGNFSSAIVKLYGHKATAVEKPYSEGFVSFYSDNPANLTQISDYQPAAPANSLVACEHVDRYVYAYPTEWIENSGYKGVSFVKISTETWADVSSSPASTYPLDMAYDYSSNTMYGVIAPNALGTRLYTVNMETGAMTEVGLLGGKLTAQLACSPQGKLYMVDNEGDFCSINKTTAAITVIGPTGISPYYKQSMAFDRNTGRLFWAMNNVSAESKLLEIEPSSGLVLDRGSFAGNAAIVGLYSVLGEEKISETKSAATFTVYPNPATDRLKIIRSATDKAQVEVYNSIDIMALSFEMTGKELELNVDKLPSGVYLIKLIDKQGCSVQRFVKR